MLTNADLRALTLVLVNSRNVSFLFCLCKTLGIQRGNKLSFLGFRLSLSAFGFLGFSMFGLQGLNQAISYDSISSLVFNFLSVTFIFYSNTDNISAPYRQSTQLSSLSSQPVHSDTLKKKPNLNT